MRHGNVVPEKLGLECIPALLGRSRDTALAVETPLFTRMGASQLHDAAQTLWVNRGSATPYLFLLTAGLLQLQQKMTPSLLDITHTSL